MASPVASTPTVIQEDYKVAGGFFVFGLLVVLAPWLIGGFVYIGGALIYGFRIPERCFPYRFDLVGASHQIFHVAVLGGFAI